MGKRMHADLPLILFAVAATISPGGATTLATASGARFGFTRSLPLMLGAACALAVLAAVSAAGLSGVLMASPSLQTAVKIAGTVYLLVLAWRIARSGAPNKSGGPDRPFSFFGGAMLLLLNPKAWAMTLGAAASFASSDGGLARLALAFGASFGLGASASLVLWCAVGIVIAKVLRTPAHWRVVNVTLSALLAASIIPTWR
jgi:threonine/homoserine/homoserine lactone efflux protein